MNTNVLNAVSPPPVVARKSTLSSWTRRMKSLLIPLTCAAVISIALVLQTLGDRRDGSAVFEFATPCNGDPAIECLYFNWPTTFGASRVAIPFVSRRIETNQYQTAMRDAREFGQLLSREYERACLEAMGVFCR